MLPNYSQIGILGPTILILFRILQGIALGGEYGGAATYVSEYAPNNRRAFYTTLITMTGTVGLLISFLLIIVSRYFTGGQFEVWGWRIPFLFSAILLLLSLLIRLNMGESPSFKRIRNAGALSESPIKESLLKWANLRRVLISFFGICAGSTCIYYTSVLYPTFFLIQTLKVPAAIVNNLATWATLVALPLFLSVGWICDRLGRKPVILVSFVGAALGFFPIFNAMALYANPALVAAEEATPIVILADPGDCSFLFNPIGARTFTNSCDLAKQTLTARGISYVVREAPKGAAATVSVGSSSVNAFDAAKLGKEEAEAKRKSFEADIDAQLKLAGFPMSADPAAVRQIPIFILLIVLMLLMTLAMVPTAPALLEMFPTRIRLTAMSIPYNFASGWIGGLLPTFSFALSAQHGNIYYGLWYPVGFITLAGIVCALFYRETKDINLDGIE